jgi:ADP-ribosylglycohydrolase
MLNRIRGAVLGQAVGDALGAPAEGMSRAGIRERYGRVTGLLVDIRERRKAESHGTVQNR